MSDEDVSLLEPHFERVILSEGDLISPAGRSTDTLCFMEAGIASYAVISPSGHKTGIGMVGFEGLAGWHVLLGCEVSPHEIAVAVGGGTALRISTKRLIEVCKQCPSLDDLLMRFVQSFMIQLGQTAVSNLHDSVERRICRWLLMIHDRLASDEVDLSHAEIGIMLGVRRASVTDALHLLEGEGLIRSSRRRIIIRDRRRLRQAGGENYGMAEAEYVRLIAPFGKDASCRPGYARPYP
jgi:CRP-like cAMP-binding protein